MSDKYERAADCIMAMARSHYEKDITGKLAFDNWTRLAQALREAVPAVSPPLSAGDDPSIDRECEPRDFSDLNEDHDE